MKMNLLTNDLLAELSADHHQQPQLSLYLPTHRHHPENQQDPVCYLNLVKKLELLLRESHPAELVRSLLKPFEALGSDTVFWNHTLDGLAVFGSPGWFRVVGLQRTVPELVVAADSFHTKPLRRFLQSADRYQILGLNQHGIKLYEGNRDSLQALEPATGVPRTIDEALGEELTEPHRTVASYGGVGGMSGPMHHGHGGKSEEVDSDADRFFRAVDRSVLEAHSRPSGLPLILAALPEHHHRFHQVSHNPFLVPEGVKMHPDSMPIDALRTHAWEIFEPLYNARLAALADDFAVAKSKGLGLDVLAEIGEAVTGGRVATLLIEADRRIAGQIQQGSGNVYIDGNGSEQGDDLLDDLGEWVVRKGGQVFVVPAAQMPATTGASAICRY
ncbi:MAG: hypothetical protein K9K30_16105 [Burkholderiaceae bacterium]|nr:hypothetical protein [Burkholderiaceae bacterium]